jgi:hypothetical protein
LVLTSERKSTVTKYLTRSEASAYLASRGVSYTTATLQKLVTRGGGPAYRLMGNRALYTTADLDAWIDHKITAPRTSSSEAA